MFIAPSDGQLPYVPIAIIDVSRHHSHRRTIADGRPSQLHVPRGGQAMVRRLLGSTRASLSATRVALLGPIVKHLRA